MHYIQATSVQLAYVRDKDVQITLPEVLEKCGRFIIIHRDKFSSDKPTILAYPLPEVVTNKS